jgi:hypothetical protein
MLKRLNSQNKLKVWVKLGGPYIPEEYGGAGLDQIWLNHARN